VNVARDLADSGTPNRDKGAHPLPQGLRARERVAAACRRSFRESWGHLRGLPHSLASSLDSGIVDAFICILCFSVLWTLFIIRKKYVGHFTPYTTSKVGQSTVSLE